MHHAIPHVMKWMTVILLLLLLQPFSVHVYVQGASCYRIFRQEDYAYCRLLSPTVALHWRDDGDGITFGMDVDGAWNWLGVGLSEAGGMLAADLAIVRRKFSGDPAWSIGDYWSTAFEPPSLDARNQDAVLLSVSSTDTATTVELWRPLDTCDEEEDARILRGTIQYIVFAYGKPWGYHGQENRGTAQLVLLPLLPTQGGAAPQPSFAKESGGDPRDEQEAGVGAGSGAAVAVSETSTNTSSSFVWEVRMSEVTIPAEPTSYLCRHAELPNPGTKVHVTDWEVVVDHPLNVHHMIIYACTQPPSEPLEIYTCTSMDPSCVTFYMLWAPGQDKAYAPPEAGFALGGDSGITWVALQVHYNNMDLQAGLVDSSGFRLGATTALRPYDMGVMAVGTIMFSIPPGMESYSSVPNLCPKACTQHLPGPVTVVWTAFHMHNLGTSIRTQWFRDGKEMAPLGERKKYGFDYQGSTFTDVTRNQLLPGDELITTCTWDSRSRTNNTYFGERTSDEMCFNFVSYYPRVRGIDICSTAAKLMGPGPLGLCTTVDKARSLGDTAMSRNISAIMGKAVGMMVTGELVDATPGNYTPYAPNCTRTTYKPPSHKAQPPPPHSLGPKKPPPSPPSPHHGPNQRAPPPRGAKPPPRGSPPPLQSASPPPLPKSKAPPPKRAQPPPRRRPPPPRPSSKEPMATPRGGG